MKKKPKPSWLNTDNWSKHELGQFRRAVERAENRVAAATIHSTNTPVKTECFRLHNALCAVTWMFDRSAHLAESRENIKRMLNETLADFGLEIIEKPMTLPPGWSKKK